MSPPFAVSAIDAKIVIYLAAPMSIAAAPAVLAPARELSSAAPLDLRRDPRGRPRSDDRRGARRR